MPIPVTCSSCNAKFNAPDAGAGKKTKCPKCGGVIQIPQPAPAEEILAAEPEFASPYTDEDFEVEPPPKTLEDSDRKPCPKCGEMIVRNAMKCRFCGEIIDPLLRAQSKGTEVSYRSDDDGMTVVDWVICILCSGIGLIMGIYYTVQGRSKGTTMLLVSGTIVALNFLLRFLVMSSQE